MEKLVLIDGNSLINRAFYAIKPLLTKDGIPTNAVYGFINMFFKILTDEKPEYVAVAFDLHAPTFRHKMYAQYKGTRKPSPEDLRPQIPLLKDILKMMNVCVLDKVGFEADDIIGTVAKSTNIYTQIYTGDRDSFQLVDNQTSVYFTKRGISEIEILSAADFKEKTGITPSQVVDLKALMGDASDNIPGVSGVGEKTALALIQKFGTLDGVYAHTSEIAGKLKEKIEADKDSAYLSQTLARIDVNCGIDCDTEKMRVKLPFPLAVKQKLNDLELKSLVRREIFFESEDGKTDAINAKSGATNQSAKIVYIENLSALPDLSGEETAVVITNNYADFTDGKTEYRIKIRETLLEDGFSASEALSALAPIFCGKNKLIVFDKKEINRALYALGITLTAPCEDVALIKYLVDFTGASETLGEVIAEYALDASMPALSLKTLFVSLYEKLKDYGMEKLYRDIELPLADVLFEMENSGFKVDVVALNATGKKFEGILKSLETQIKEMCGEEDLNVNSPRRLGEILFEKMKIGKGKKTKTGYSTSADVLEEYESASPVIPIILEYRRIQKLQSTYIEGFKPLVEKSTGLIHTRFNQTVTATGRLSSKEPNLQNIPVREDEGKELRKFFVPKTSDRILIGADYSQIELRLLASFSGCKGLIAAFKNGEDVHATTAAKVFKTDIKSVTPTMRRAAKAVNFGIIYGISEYGLAKNIKTTSAQAKEYISKYFIEFPEVKKYMDDNVAFAKEHGYSQTFTGRRRYIRELKSDSYQTRQFGERVAMNMPLQGAAADVIKIAMLNVFNRLKKENLKSELILQVHDELIVDALKSEQDEVVKILKEEMESAVSFVVPLTVEAGMGETWFDAK